MGDRRQANGKEGEVAISVLDKDSLGSIFDRFIGEERCATVSAPARLASFPFVRGLFTPC